MKKVAFFFHFSLDWVRLYPFIQEFLKRDKKCQVQIYASNTFHGENADIVKQYNIKVLPHWRLRLGLLTAYQFDYLFVAALSSHPAHIYAHSAVRFSHLFGVQTFCVQHGFECLGLTYLSPNQEGDEINAKQVLHWVNSKYLTRRSAKDRKNYIKIRYPHLVPNEEETRKLSKFIRSGLGQFKKIVLIAENLHWERYSAYYRETAVSDLISTAQVQPDICFLIKPHPAGKFFEASFLKEKPGNIVLTRDVNSQSLPFPVWAAAADCVVSTPSTVIVDSVVAGKPTALIRYDCDVGEFYPHLAVIDGRQDWLSILYMLDNQVEQFDQNNRAFVEAVLGEAPEISDLVDRIIFDDRKNE